MKYQCGVIRDLLPLYQDGVCSAESRETVDEHLTECNECTEYYRKLSSGETEIAVPEREQQKAASFKAVRRRIVHGRIIAIAASVVVVIGVLIAAFVIMNRTVRTVTYKNGNITVSMQAEGLVAKLGRTEHSGYHVKHVTAEIDGQTKELKFVCIYESLWSAFIAAESKALSELMICPADKSADNVDRVYYYTGEYTGLESLSPEELAEVIENSVLLWEKQP